ncbi:hypothetical protein BJX99DRAFT_88380 [Aspergillus californicus]
MLIESNCFLTAFQLYKIFLPARYLSRTNLLDRHSPLIHLNSWVYPAHRVVDVIFSLNSSMRVDSRQVGQQNLNCSVAETELSRRSCSRESRRGCTTFLFWHYKKRLTRSSRISQVNILHIRPWIPQFHVGIIYLLRLTCLLLESPNLILLSCTENVRIWRLFIYLSD